MISVVIFLAKILLCIVIVLSSTVLGFYYSNRLYRRKEILQLFINNLKVAQTHIRYESCNICEVFCDKFPQFTFDSEKVFFSQWAELLKIYETFLTKSDIKLLTSFAKNLGKTDVSGEISHIQMYIELLNTCVNEAEKSINSKSKLYRTFGVSVGLLISIMLI